MLSVPRVVIFEKTVRVILGRVVILIDYKIVRKIHMLPALASHINPTFAGIGSVIITVRRGTYQLANRFALRISRAFVRGTGHLYIPPYEKASRRLTVFEFP